MHGPHVSLYYDGFGEFLQNCQTVELDAEACKFTEVFVREMSGYFDSKAQRTEAIQLKLGAYLTGGCLAGVDNADVAFQSTNGYRILIIEVKNEVGKGSCDSFMQVIAYYMLSLKNHDSSCCAPAFLMEIVGVHMAIYGAIYTTTVCCDRLSPCLWLTLQPNDVQAMTNLARTFKALKIAVSNMLTYYQKPPSHSHRFPCYVEYNNGCGTVQFEYQEVLMRQVFLAKASNGQLLVVKFVEEYGEAAHRLCEENGFAPKLYFCGNVGKFIMVVMQYLEDSVSLVDFLRKDEEKEEKIRVLNQVKEAAKVLHTGGYCHGDLRPSNVLVIDTVHRQRIQTLLKVLWTVTSYRHLLLQHTKNNKKSPVLLGPLLVHRKKDFSITFSLLVWFHLSLLISTPLGY